MGEYATTFRTWKSAKARLKDTLQDYLEASIGLNEQFATQTPSTSSSQLRENELAEINLELQSLPGYMQTLERSKQCLVLTQGAYRHMLSPISSLPVEVLRIILSFATRFGAVKYGLRTLRPPTSWIIALSSVSKVWRQLMLNSPEFWTSPELVLEGSASEPCYHAAGLWAERSQGALLDVFISEFANCSELARISHDCTAGIGNLMTTFLTRARTLTIGASARGDTVYTILNCWVVHGSVGWAERLDVWHMPIADEPEPHRNRLAHIHAEVSNGNFVDFFQPLRSLSATRAGGRFEHLVHNRLTELHIEKPADWLLPLRHIHNLLAGAPGLRSLRLIGALIAEPDISTLDYKRRVALDHLQTLVLEGDHSWQILSAITSTSKGIKTSLTFSCERGCSPVLSCFFSRVNISHLYMRLIAGETKFMSRALVHMPHLCSLALHEFELNKLVEGTVNFGRIRRRGDVWPALREIRLIDCSAGPFVLGFLLSLCTPKTLFWSSSEPSSILKTNAEEAIMKRGVELVRAAWESPSVDFWECK